MFERMHPGKLALKAAAAVLVACVVASPSLANAQGRPVTSGPNYDRNPSVVQDGGTTYLFFARSTQPCNRLDGCNADLQTYDLWLQVSRDGGRTFEAATLIAFNPGGATVFYGRTIAAVRATAGPAAGTIYVFWASGGNSSELWMTSKAPQSTSFSPLTPVAGTTPGEIFNVDAIAGPDGVFLYTEECCSALGLFAYRFDGAIASDRTSVAPFRSLPKALFDGRPGSSRYRLTYVDATLWPDVPVSVASSADGLSFEQHQLVVSTPGVSNWDPSLSQIANGRYLLTFAPDAGDGRQRIAATTSGDFVSWSQPEDLTTAVQDGVAYWDYWPEPTFGRSGPTLYFTSERGAGTDAPGTGHIWSDR